ncbi:MAG: hypothetical protein ACK5XR_08900 [Pseudanabaena sp.]
MTVTTKQQIIQEVESMSESDLTKVLTLLQSFGLTKHKPHITNAKYPLRGLPVEYVDPLEPVALSDWELA